MKTLRQGHGGKTPNVPQSRNDPRKSSQGAKRLLTGYPRRAGSSPVQPHMQKSTRAETRRMLFSIYTILFLKCFLGWQSEKDTLGLPP